MKEISFFSFRWPKVEREENFQENLANGGTWSLFSKQKIPRKLLEFMSSWLSLLLYLKFREAGNEARDVRAFPERGGVCVCTDVAENIISVNYDETRASPNRGRHRRKVGDKWGHEL